MSNGITIRIERDAHADLKALDPDGSAVAGFEIMRARYQAMTAYRPSNFTAVELAQLAQIQELATFDWRFSLGDLGWQISQIIKVHARGPILENMTELEERVDRYLGTLEAIGLLTGLEEMRRGVAVDVAFPVIVGGE